MLNKNILVPMANGTEESEAVIVIDLLRRTEANVIISGLSKEVITSHNIVIKTSVLLDDINSNTIFDAIILPGGLKGVEAFCNNKHLIELLKNNYIAKSIIGAICAAPIVLEKANILTNNDTFTCHPSVINKINLKNHISAKTVWNNNKQIITSQGLGTAFEFSFEIIKKLYNYNIANTIASNIVYYNSI